jgi:hypothetical protein
LGRKVSKSILLAAGLAGLALLCVGASFAQAETSFCPPGEGAGQCTEAEGLATDFQTQRVYVADRGNRRVDVFHYNSGTEKFDFLFAFGWKVNKEAPLEQLQKCTTVTGCQKGSSGSGDGQFSGLAWVAVDNTAASPSRHDVYVTDNGNHRVQKFDEEGSFLAKFGSTGFGAGQFEDMRGIGVSGTGNPYVADTKSEGNCEGDVSKGATFAKRVQKLSEALTPLEEWKPTDSNCGQVRGFAVESGGAYYMANEGPTEAVRRYLPGATSAACKADEGMEAKGLAVDEADRLFAAQKDPRLTPGADFLTIGELDSACAHLRRFGYGKIGGRMFGLAALHTASGDVLGTEVEGPHEIRYLAIPPSGPLVASTEVVSLGNTKATVRAEVNPEGKETHYHFEYLTQVEYEANGNNFTGAKSTPSKVLSVAAGREFRVNQTEATLLGCVKATPEAVANGECLAPLSKYRWRVVVENADGPGEGPVEGTPSLFETKQGLEIIETFATAVGSDSATLNARVNPLGIAAEGLFEYVDQADYEADVGGGGDGFEGAGVRKVPDPEPPASEAQLPFGEGEAPVKRSVAISGLKEGTTYHYRLVASNFATSISSEEATIHTYRAAPAQSCPANEAFRGGASALLPDCRAYELVSPLDKEGGDIVILPELQTERPAVLAQSSANGDRLAYGSIRAFGDAASAPYTSQYIAGRGAGAWASHGIIPAEERSLKAEVIADTEYRYFSEDLCQGWLIPFTEPPLAAGALAGYFNLYRREDQLCGGAPDLTTLSDAKPANLPPFDVYKIEVQGVSEDGEVTAFVTNDNLEGTAAPANPNPGTQTQLYVKAAGDPGAPVFACVLPGGTASNPCSAGTGDASRLPRMRTARETGALSGDGKSLYWSNVSEGEGKIYLRQNPLGEGSECSGPEAPCTVAVSEAGEALSGTSRSSFWAGAKDGSKALYSTGALGGANTDLYEYTVVGAGTQKIAGKLYGVVGQSEDLSHVYFASGEEIKPGGEELENQRGEKPKAGKPNLYLYEAAGGGGYRFLATLAAGDVSLAPVDQNQSSATSVEADKHNGQVSGDGLGAAFMSEAPLSGFDNTDARSTEPCGAGHPKGICDNEVFLYDATARGGEGELVCASCNPGGARPAGRNVAGEGSPMQAAARLPVFATTLYRPRALSEGGNRLMFESVDPLAARDSNGKIDVYEWERPGTGGCEEASASFSAQDGGCVELLSSGQSERDSELVDASTSGGDVFFTTLSSLLPQDYGLVDIYDARVNGGQPTPPPPGVECEGESCQRPPGAPEFQTPASASNEGPEDGEAAKPKKHKHHKKHKHSKKPKKHKRASRGSGR